MVLIRGHPELNVILGCSLYDLMPEFVISEMERDSSSEGFSLALWWSLRNVLDHPIYYFALGGLLQINSVRVVHLK